MEPRSNRSPLCSFGLLSDVQYADVEDGHSFCKNYTRHYRNALVLLERAVAELSKPEHDISFILQLGDLFDGHCKRSKSPGSVEGLHRVLRRLHAFPNPVYNVWGNHELYNFSRAALLNTELNSAKKIAETEPKHWSVKPPIHTNCYDFSPVEGFRIVVLDQYEVSLLGLNQDSAEYQIAENIIKAYNTNNNLNNPEGLLGEERRFVQFNGGVSAQQLQWLDCILQYAEERKEKVLVAGHIPIYKAATKDDKNLCWNFPDILNTLQKYRCVVAYFAGHEHTGGFATDQCGIHHLTVAAIVETAPDDDAFAIVEFHEDRVRVRGFGRVLSKEFIYRDSVGGTSIN